MAVAQTNSIFSNLPHIVPGTDIDMVLVLDLPAADAEHGPGTRLDIRAGSVGVTPLAISLVCILEEPLQSDGTGSQTG